jgi:4-hydroxybenzoate polyprenyltransferase/phosphoserine phosphatase
VEPTTIDLTLPADRSEATSEFLCTDLDGTILLVDSLWESLLALIGARFWYAFLIPFWLLRGKAALKHEIARRVVLNPAALPLDGKVVEYLRKQKHKGRKLILATGADAKIAEAIAGHLGFFDFVLASDGVTNLTGERKKAAIQQLVQGKDFDYIGNSWEDIPIWSVASTAIVVRPSTRLLKTVRSTVSHTEVLEGRRNYWASIWRSLRPHHWVKNLLVFVPIVLAHDLSDVHRLMSVIVAWASFSLCASGVYLLNDLFDLEADRIHPTKKHRPFASGAIPVWIGLAMAPLLLGSGLLVAAGLEPEFFVGVIVLYILATTGYSVYAKRVPILDVLVLTGLYLLRILGGGVAAQVPVSMWLLAFSMFLLLSLAFTKRHAELVRQVTNRETTLTPSKRDYRMQDTELVQQFGVTSGYISVLVLALYVNAEEVSTLYQHPKVLWLTCPMLLFWVSRIWFLANRGKLSEDPVVFAASDPFSYILSIFLFLVLFLASGNFIDRLR